MKNFVFWGKLLLYQLILLSVLAFVLPTAIYEFDLLQSFAAHALVGYAGLLLLLLLFRQWWLSVAAGGAVVVLLLFLSPYVLPASPRLAAEGPSFTVAHFNVLRSNRQYDPTVRQALASRADLLSFQEVNQRWVDQLVPRLCHAYPYHYVVTDTPGGQGLAVFSRHRLRNVRTHYWSGVPAVVGDIDLSEALAGCGGLPEGTASDTTVHFVAAHTLSPRSETRYRRRNAHLQQMARYLESVEGPVLAIGDYNAVPWNPTIVAMKRRARLYDSRRSITPTYPSRLREGGIPIDYVLHSDEFTCLDFRAVPIGGSDHRGVVGRYRLASTVL